MTSANEAARLENLKQYQILDTPAEECYDRIVNLAAQLFQVPIAAISLIDETRQWFKAQTGLGVRETPREWSFCSVAIEQEDAVFVVPQPETDPRFCDNPLVTAAPFIRFYAGAKLVDSRGFTLGALCIIDTREHSYPTEAERSFLTELARVVSQQLELDRTKRELAEKEHLLSLAESMSRVGHWSYNVKTGKVFWSNEVYRFFGRDPALPPLAYEEALKAYPPEQRIKVEQSVANAIATGQGYELRRDHIGPDGRRKVTQSSAVCQLGQDGKVESLIGVFQDITGYVVAIDAAKAATAIQADFLANMSHEIRTPLTSVVGYAGLLNDMAGLSSEAKHYADQVMIASNALMATVNDILDFSKLEAGQIKLCLEPVAIRRLLNEAVRIFENQASSKYLAITLTVDEHVPEALALDPDRLRQILLNLIGNAVKFTEAGSVEVRAVCVAGLLEISVSDTGPGIPSKQLGMLFKRFSQLESGLNRGNGGTGLGLAICKGLADLMGATISVTSEPGRGSAFSLLLPCQEVSTVHASAPPVDYSLQGYRVLVLDDTPANLDFAVRTLGKAGARVYCASDLENALGYVGHDEVDMVLLDIHMPSIGGLEALSKLRAGRHIPIMAFTADVSSDRQEAFYRGKGFDGLIAKPITPKDFVHQVAIALGVVPTLDFGSMANAR